MASILLPGHVVRFVPRDDVARAPEVLPVARPLGRSARVILGALLVLAAVVAAGLISALWTQPTPGAWFSALFTVMISGLVLALVLAYIGALRDGRARAEAAQLWSRAHKHVAEHGRIVAREVSTQEDGQVGSFTLSVAVEGGAELHARWSMPRASSGAILQSQVPVVGQPVRVWRLEPGHGDSAHVIDVVDPSAAESAR